MVNDNASDRQPVLMMSCFGQIGKFGNQIFQYAFLRICAEKSGARVECPPWIGQTLFGHHDDPISQLLPPAIERKDTGESLFEVIPEYIPYLEKLANAKHSRIGPEALELGLANMDLWGFFIFHTRFLRPYQQYFCSLFQPVSDLKSALENGLNVIRAKGKTIVGVHIRRGDYVTNTDLGFTLLFPSRWYCEWLDGIWNELEEPILFLCSDELDYVISDFEKFSPLTFRDLDVNLPERMRDLKIEFYIDFYMLSNCDVVLTSNSSFSFTACMLNERGTMFVRPHWDFSTKFTVFEPWDSEPVLWPEGKSSKFFKPLTSSLYTTFVTQGFWAMLKSLFVYLPKSYLNVWISRGYLAYQIQGRMGVVKILLHTLGWQSVWKQTKLKNAN